MTLYTMVCMCIGVQVSQCSVCVGESVACC